MPKVSPLVGTTLASAALRQRYDSVLLGIKRGKSRSDGQFKDLELKAGDILLLDAGKAADIHGASFTSDFSDIHEVKAGEDLRGRAVGRQIAMNEIPLRLP